MKGIGRPKGGGRRGAAALEFALILPVILVILSAVADYGWFLAMQTHVVQAARDGVRVGVTVDRDSGDDPAATAADHVGEVLTNLGLPCAAADGCEITAALETAGTLDTLRVTVRMDYQPPAGIVPTPEVLQAVFSMAMEDQ
jgi:Flp pilus assembly protein TadG